MVAQYQNDRSASEGVRLLEPGIKECNQCGRDMESATVRNSYGHVTPRLRLGAIASSR